MFPVIFKIGNFAISSYGVMNMLGYIAAVFYLIKYKKRVNTDADTIWNIMFIVILAAILGGKIMYIIVSWGELGPTIADKLRNILTNFRYGFVFFGGFIAGVTSLAVYLIKKKLPLVKMADFLIVALPLGHAIGRVGCFLVGCCYGKPWNGPWAVTFTDPQALVATHLLGVPLHPTQLYEAFANLIIFAVLHFSYQKKHRAGSIVLLYAAFYGLLRFGIEFFRGDFRGGFFLGMSPSQLVSVGIVFAAAVLYFGFVKRGRVNEGK